MGKQSVGDILYGFLKLYQNDILWDLQEQSKSKMSRLPTDYRGLGKTLLLTDCPITTETIRAYTGVRVPSARPLSLYLTPRYKPINGEVLLFGVSSTSGITQNFIFQ